MKSRTLTCITAITLFVALAIPVQLDAQHHHYTLVDLGTFGGQASYINPFGNGGPYLNGQGAAVGSSQTSIPVHPNFNGFPCVAGPTVFHAFEWRNGVVTDLHSLGGNDNCSNALAVNDRGAVVGISENGVLDPVLDMTQIRAVLWKDGQIIDLGTLGGGNESAASAVNDRGQVVGFYLNAIPDPLSILAFDFGVPPAGLTQTRAFLWQNGQMQDLDTLGGPDALAIFINARGQVAGYSYTNSTASPTGFPTQDPFLWENGKMIDLGNFGGDLGIPAALNNRGQVVGFSCLPGDQICDPFLWDSRKLIDLFMQTGGTFAAAFDINDAGTIAGLGIFPSRTFFDAALWNNGVVTDLGFLSGDCASFAVAINSAGQVAGNSFSCDFTSARSFIWENGSMADLSTLVTPSSDFQLAEVDAINDHGEIAGTGLPAGCADFSCSHAYLLIPSGDEVTAGSTMAAQNVLGTASQTALEIEQKRAAAIAIMTRIRARSGRNRGPWK